MVPGLVVGLSIDGEQHFLSFGETSVDAPRPVTADTLFQIGSISKTYTCLALLSYVENGRFELDRPVRDYLSQFRVADDQASNQVTIRHLLTHVAGWQGDYFVNTGRGDDALAQYVAHMVDLPQIAQVGRFLSYNNAGFNLAGYLIEIASGKPYEAAVKEAVFDPLGLSSTFFFAEDVISRQFAVGHHPGNGGVEVARPWALARCGHPVGGIATTIRDLMRYSAYYLDEEQSDSGRRVVNTDTQKSMMSPQHWIWQNKEAVGLSWFIDNVNGTHLISHGGSTNGQVSGLFLVPSRQFGIGVCTNSSRGGALINLIRHWALREFAGVEKDTEIQQALTPDFGELIGRYLRPFAEIEIGESDGRLTAEMNYLGGFPTRDDPPYPNPPPLKLVATEPDRFVVPDGPAKGAVIDILRDDGKVGWVRFQRRLFAKVP